jgi:hypothetical protein
MPVNAQLAFVVFAHRPADHLSHLPELLDHSGAVMLKF